MRTRYNNNHRNLGYLIFLAITLILLGIPSYIWTHKNVTTLASRYNSTMTPTIMIPGSSANANRFDDLIKAVDTKYNQKHSVLKLTVQTNGKIKYTGSLLAADKHPFIIVAFQNSQDGYPTIKKQAAWFNIAFNSLKNRYRFNSFNAFGHSNGAIVWTIFLEKYFDDSSITIKRLLTVGAPFNLEENNDTKRTQMLADLIKGRDNIPENMAYYSVAGTQLYENDGIVPLKSVDSGKYIFEGKIKHYTLITLTGSTAEHTDMLTNTQFVDIFHQYLLPTTKKATNNKTTK